MLRTEQQAESAEARYDPETLKKVIALAGRLQDRHQETLTAGQMEEVGADVGLDAAFIRQALAQVTRTHARSQAQHASSVELKSILLALGFPLLWGPLAFLLRHNPDLMTILSQVMPGPIAAILGFVAGKRRIGFLAGVALGASLLPVWGDTIPRFWSDGPLCIVFPLVGGILGKIGASLRETYFPFQPESQLSQREVLSALAALQSDLQKHQPGGADGR